MDEPRVKVPKTASAGEVITIKTMVRHAMQSGLRKDAEGNTIPRDMINKFECSFNNALVFSCDIDQAVSANPFFEFRARVIESGVFRFVWTDENGSKIEAEESIDVS